MVILKHNTCVLFPNSISDVGKCFTTADGCLKHTTFAIKTCIWMQIRCLEGIKQHQKENDYPTHAPVTWLKPPQKAPRHLHIQGFFFLFIKMACKKGKGKDYRPSVRTLVWPCHHYGSTLCFRNRQAASWRLCPIIVQSLVFSSDKEECP